MRSNEKANATQSSVLGAQHSDFSPQSSLRDALERMAIATRRSARGQHAGAVRSRFRGRALEFADYRPYTPGDDPRLVDWRAYTRLGRLYLKQYEEERTRTLTLLLDCSGSLDWGEGEDHKGRYSRRLAAALAWISLSRHEPVRTFLLKDGHAAPLPLVATRPGAVTLFRQLEETHEAGRTNLAAAVRAALQACTMGPTILLSDLLDSTWVEALGALATTGESMLLQVLAPEEWEPSLGGEVELEDTESGELRATRLGPVELAAYHQRLDAFLGEVRHQCNRLDIIHLALNTGTPLHEAVLRQLPAAGVLERS